MKTYSVIQLLEPIGKYDTAVLYGEKHDNIVDAILELNNMLPVVNSNSNWKLVDKYEGDKYRYSYYDEVIGKEIFINYFIEDIDE